MISIRFKKNLFWELFLVIFALTQCSLIFLDWLMLKAGIIFDKTLYFLILPLVFLFNSPILVSAYFDGKKYKRNRSYFQIIMCCFFFVTSIISPIVYFFYLRKGYVLLVYYILIHFFIFAIWPKYKDGEEVIEID